MPSSEWLPWLEPFIKSATNYTSDSRHVGAGSIFVALKGAQRDGHSFLDAVVRQKPALIIVSESFTSDDARKNPNETFATKAAALGVAVRAVTDTAAAHRALAYGFRRRYKGKIIGVGGSAGKTTTKDFLYTILSQRFKVMKTEHSQNGEAGIPKTLERLSDEFEVAVIEIGIDAPGDMVRHEDLVAPDLAVLTSIGPEHLNLLKSIDNVFKEERLLFEGTQRRGGTCFAPVEDPWLVKLKGESHVVLVEETVLPLNCPVEQPVARRNASLAVAVAKQLGMSDDAIAAGVRALALPKGRGGQFAVHPHLTLIADYYNSNPASLKEGVAFAAEMAKKQGGDLHLLLGDMLDLGTETAACHEEIMSFLKRFPVKSAVLVGPAMAEAYRKDRWPKADVTVVENTAAAVPLASALRDKNGVLLAKGSRGMALEKVLDGILPGKFS